MEQVLSVLCYIVLNIEPCLRLKDDQSICIIVSVDIAGAVSQKGIRFRNSTLPLADNSFDFFQIKGIQVLKL